jgi:hypothetical protein
MKMNARKNTCKLLDMMEEGMISAEQVARMCLSYMSEDDVADMMDCNELSDRFLEEDDVEEATDVDPDEYWSDHG